MNRCDDIRHDKKERAGGRGDRVAETRIGEGVEGRSGGGGRGGGSGGRMGTQKGRVDVQQQPPSLLQTPQLPGAAPARPEVTRLLPTTRLRLALPLSISLLPPSFASRAFPVSLRRLSLPPAHHHPLPTRTPLHCHLHAYTLGG